MCLMQGVYFAWLRLARAADFTMDGLISAEALALTAHGRDLYRMPWGVKGFVHPDSSPDTLSPAPTIYSIRSFHFVPYSSHTLHMYIYIYVYKDFIISHHNTTNNFPCRKTILFPNTNSFHSRCVSVLLWLKCNVTLDLGVSS